MLKAKHWLLIIFNLIYVITFAVYYISIKNYEFLWYVAVLVFFFIFLGMTLLRYGFDYITLWGLSIWGFLHMAGGGVRINGSVLYKLHLLDIYGTGEYYILKFDQFVHFFGFGVAAMLVFYLLYPHLKEKVNYKLIYFISIIASMGLGALNEIVEFIAVVIFPETGVGGYYNTALDLVFNTLGALAGIVLVHLRRILEDESKIS